MTRWVAVFALALSVSSSPLHAQSTMFTVTVPSADIRQSPSASSPIVGHRNKGQILDVRRELGSWVEVAWPAASSGVAYINLNMGSIRHSAPAPRRPMTIAEYAATNTPLRPAAASTTGALATADATCSCVQSPVVTSPAVRTSTAAAPMRPATTYVVPKHSLGVGGKIGGATRSVGATGRAWSQRRIGVQLEISSDASANAGAARLRSQQVASSVLYAPPSWVGDFVWLRPYAGGGTTFYRSTLNSTTLAVGERTTDHGLGVQVFGGGELTFASVPRFALSADIGYHKWPASLTRFEPRKLGIKVSAHWYVR